MLLFVGNPRCLLDLSASANCTFPPTAPPSYWTSSQIAISSSSIYSSSSSSPPMSSLSRAGCVLVVERRRKAIRLTPPSLRTGWLTAQQASKIYHNISYDIYHNICVLHLWGQAGWLLNRPAKYIIIYYNVSSISEDRLLNRTGKSKHEGCRRDEIRVELSLDQKESIRVIFNKRNPYHHHLFIISGAKAN